MSTPIIEITNSTILQIGDFRILVEPITAKSLSPGLLSPRIIPAPKPEPARPAAPVPSPAAVPRPPATPPNPRDGSTYLTPNGDEIRIAHVIGHDGGLWFVVDVEHRPVALRWTDSQWHALPPDERAPQPGEIVQRGGFDTRISEVFGEGEVGGWAVRDDTRATLHVLHSVGNRWMSFGAITPELSPAA